MTSCASKNTDGWTFELAALQGQDGIALLLSRAAASEASALSLFHHSLHINETAGENGAEETKGRGAEKEEKE